MENSLISAIFRKLPLKWLLVILAVGGVLFASFSSAETINNSNGYAEFHYHSRAYGTFDYSPSEPGMSCVMFDSQYPSASLFDGTNTYTSELSNWNLVCTNSDTVILTVNSAENYYNFYFSDENWLRVLFPNFTSLQCQTEYNLIPISSVDSNYCTTNNLCPSSGTPSDCPNVGVSNLFINDIFHPGAFNIVMNIPEEIDWEYAYTNSGNNFNLDVIGYNQDTEYINGLIDVQNYKPTSEDFTNVFNNFSNFGGLLIACLFVILVFYFVKKMF